MKKVNSIYNLGIILLTIKMWFFITNIFEPTSWVQNLFTLVITILFGVKIFFTKSSYKEFIIIAIIGIFIFITSQRIMNIDIFLSVLSILAAKDIEIKNTIRIILKVNFAFIILHIAYFIMCYFFEPYKIEYIMDDNIPRYTFFMRHPNYLGATILWTVSAYVFLYFENKKRKSLLLIIITLIFVYVTCKSRTTILMFGILLLLLMLVDKIKKKTLSIIVQISFIMATVISIFFASHYFDFSGRMKIVSNEINSALTGRVRLSAIGLERYGYTLLGRFIDTEDTQVLQFYGIKKLIIDNFYISCCINYGVFYLIIIEIGLIKICKRIDKKKLIFLLLFIIVGLTERYVIYSTLVFPLLFFSEIYNKKRKGKEYMKIGFLMKSPFAFGGEQRVTSVIASALAERGHDVSIIYTSFDKPVDRKIYNLNKNVKLYKVEGKIKKINIKRIIYKLIKKVNENTSLLINNIDVLEKIYYKRDKKFLKNICNIINYNNFDIVIGVSGYYSIILAMLKCKLNCKIFGWQHNCCEAYFDTKNKYYWHQEVIFKKYLKELDRYIVLTNYDKININKRFNIDSVVINNPRSFSSDEKTTLKAKKFLALGRLEEAKGYDLLLESFKLFAQKNQEWNLDIVGDGSKKDFINSKIKKYKLEERVKMYPFTKNVKEHMLKSSVFLFPSRWEGFGLVILEAFEIGLPVIAYELGPVKEIIDNNIDGFLIKKFDTEEYARVMLELSTNNYKLEEMSKNAIKKSNKYSIQNILKIWEEIL